MDLKEVQREMTIEMRRTTHMLWRRDSAVASVGGQKRCRKTFSVINCCCLSKVIFFDERNDVFLDGTSSHPMGDRSRIGKNEDCKETPIFFIPFFDRRVKGRVGGHLLWCSSSMWAVFWSWFGLMEAQSDSFQVVAVRAKYFALKALQK